MFGDLKSGRSGKLIGLSSYEILEGEFRYEAGAKGRGCFRYLELMWYGGGLRGHMRCFFEGERNPNRGSKKLHPHGFYSIQEAFFYPLQDKAVWSQ